MLRLRPCLTTLLATSLAFAGCSKSNDDSTLGPGPDATLFFELEGESVEESPFPSDVYLEHLTSVVVPQIPVPVLSTPTFRGLLDPTGALEAGRVGGFSLNHAGAINLQTFTAAPVPRGLAFLNQLSTTLRFGYAAHTEVTIPVSAVPGAILDIATVSAPGTVRLFDLGVPSFQPGVGLTALSGPAQELAIGELKLRGNAINLRPQVPFTPSTSLDPFGFGRKTIGVLVTDGVLRTTKGGLVRASAQYDAVRNGDLSAIPQPAQAALARYVTESDLGLGLISTLDPTVTRAGTAVYFQFTITDDARSMQLLTAIANGQAPLNGSQLGGAAQAFVGLNDGQPSSVNVDVVAGIDGVPGSADDPATVTTTSTPSIADLYNTVFGPFSGTTTAISVSFDLLGNATSTVVSDGARIIPGLLAGGSLTVNVGQANQANFTITGNSANNLTVRGDVSSAAGGQAVSFLAVPVTGGGAAVPQAGIAQISSGLLTTPSFMAPATPAAPATPGDPVGIPFFTRTFLSTAGITPADPNNALTAPAFIPFSPTDPVVQFGINRLPFLAFYPDATVFPGARPVVVGIHGFTRQKEDLMLLASAVCSSGSVLVCIDVYQHGDRQVVPSLSIDAVAQALLPVADGDNSGKLDENGFPDPFINPTALARTRDKLRQSLFDQLCLIRAVAGGATFDAAGTAVDGTQIRLAGQSLGGIAGTILTAISPNIERAVLNVPGGSVTGILADSPSIAPGFDGLLVATGNADFDINPAAVNALLAGTAGATRFTRENAPRVLFDIVATTVTSSVDPLVFADRMLTGFLRGGSTPSVLVQFVLGDQVVPNNSNSRLAAAFNVGGTLVAVTPTTTFLNPFAGNAPQSVTFPILFDVPTLPSATASSAAPFVGNAMVQFDAAHGFLLAPDFNNLAPTFAGQTQVATFLAAGVTQ